jgi:hypothetical protein
MQNITGVVTQATSITRERAWQKLWRSVSAVALGAALYYLQPFPEGLWSNVAWVVVGVLFAGEWLMLPLRLLIAAAKDAAVAIKDLRTAILGK